MISLYYINYNTTMLYYSATICILWVLIKGDGINIPIDFVASTCSGREITIPFTDRIPRSQVYFSHVAPS